MPYPLPDGGLPYTADLRWFLVAVPDDAAFVRAALGAYTEFTHYWKWGKEGKEEGREEAAQVWEAAISETLRAWEMSLLDTLIAAIDGVEPLLQQLVLKDVCCGTETPGGGLPQTDYTYDDQDDVPANVISAGYASGVSDYTGMEAYKCMISHLYVRNVAGKLNEYAKYFDLSGDLTLSIAGVAAIAAALFVGAAITGFIALPLIGIEMLLGIGAAAGIFGALGELGEASLQDAADELVDNADEYVCAIFAEDGPAAGYTAFNALVTTNLSAGIASLIDLIAGLQDLASLYTGRYADSDIAQELADLGYDSGDFDCTCVGALIGHVNLSSDARHSQNDEVHEGQTFLLSQATPNNGALYYATLCVGSGASYPYYGNLRLTVKSLGTGFTAVSGGYYGSAHKDNSCVTWDYSHLNAAPPIDYYYDGNLLFIQSATAFSDAQIQVTTIPV